MKKIVLSISIIAFLIFITKQWISANPKTMAQELLAAANITINGSKDEDIVINDDSLYARAISQGSLGLGEAYMDGLWDCRALDQFFDTILSAQLDQKIPKNLNTFVSFLKAKVINLQSPSRAFEVGEKHYDLDNDLFKLMLDKNMIYSCAYWKNADNLDAAQENKLDLICKKLYLKPGMKLLDIGCGWGGLAKFAAQNYGVEVVGITISKEQAEYAQENTKGLPVQIRLQDYRDLNEQFDRIVSVGMFEHVGYKNYKTFMEVTNKLLKDDGLMLLHTIGNNISQFTGDEWINKYIFPNGMLPSINQISDAFEGLFVMEDWHNFGPDYDKTLMAWYNNFIKAWPELKSRYSDRFYRMWTYYLLMCAGTFRSRKIQLWQIVLSKHGVPGGYVSIR